MPEPLPLPESSFSSDRGGNHSLLSSCRYRRFSCSRASDLPPVLPVMDHLFSLRHLVPAKLQRGPGSRFPVDPKPQACYSHLACMTRTTTLASKPTGGARGEHIFSRLSFSRDVRGTQRLTPRGTPHLPSGLHATDFPPYIVSAGLTSGSATVFSFP